MAWAASSIWRKRRRNRRERTRTERKKRGRLEIHLDWSAERPPLGTIMCTWGWWVMAEPQVCSTAVMPILAPRCLGSAAT